jgi:hypothetical protein
MCKKKKITKQKSKNSGADGIQSPNLWIKNSLPYRLRYGGLAASVEQQNIYVAIVIMKVQT